MEDDKPHFYVCWLASEVVGGCSRSDDIGSDISALGGACLLATTSALQRSRDWQLAAWQTCD
jgi:hypothetical protein